MKEFLDKLASYHLFNYLLPGGLFVFLANKFVNIDLYQTDIVFGLFLYYFIGLVISRIGSLILEPFLRRSKFVAFADYKDFVYASKIDLKIEQILEVNNMYRTLFTLFLVLFLMKLYKLIEASIHFVAVWDEYLFIGILFFMFLFSYKKQSRLISERVKANKQTSKTKK